MKNLMSCFVTVKNMLLMCLGDARLAKSVKNKVFSLDLVSNDPSVIACDMSNVGAKLYFFCFIGW